MGQKINPNGFRLAVTRAWASRWYASSRNFADMLAEDLKVREYLKKKLKSAAVSKVQIERPLLLLLDLLHGPQNIGALLRTAEACGVHGVILQDRRAPEITPSVVQFAAGATEHLLIAKVTNLAETMRRLKDAGVWLAGMDLDDTAEELGRVDLDRALGIVVGHEGEGLRRLVRDRCDFLVRLPMRGRVESLNAAVAGSILLYAAWQARGFTR